MDCLYGIDIGGTNIKMAALSDRGELLHKGSIPTESVSGPEKTASRVAEWFGSLPQLPGRVTGAGVGCAGLINSGEGVLYTSPNLPGWNNIDLAGIFSKNLSIPVVIDNDVNCAAYGEFMLGSGRGFENFICITLGTGVGSVACGGSTQWLPVHVGDRKARGILFLNQRYPAYTSLAMGLVNVVVPTVKGPDGEFVTRFAGGRTYLADWNMDPWDDPFENRATAQEISKAHKGKDGYSIDLSRLDEVVADLCEQVINKFFECTRYTKAQVNFWKELSWHATAGHARDWLSTHYTCLEPHEGMTAFVEKRKVDFVGMRRRMADPNGSSEFLWGPYARTCPKCEAKGIPAFFEYCGKCGAKLS
jgi:hypothetical protein